MRSQGRDVAESRLDREWRRGAAVSRRCDDDMTTRWITVRFWMDIVANNFRGSRHAILIQGQVTARNIQWLRGTALNSDWAVKMKQAATAPQSNTIQCLLYPKTSFSPGIISPPGVSGLFFVNQDNVRK